jgi:hypothetical protein
LNAERFDPLEIVQAFNRRGVEYVVIGGMPASCTPRRCRLPATST